MSGSTSLVAVQVTADSLFASDSEEVLLSALDYFARDGYPAYDVSPDDERFVMFRASEAGPWKLILVQNFFEELKRLMPIEDR
jgi:hypothetical protein